MPVEKQYQGSRDQKDFEALRDLKEWLSRAQWMAMKQYLKAEPDVKNVVTAMAFVGVQGYPVSAAIRAFGNEELKRRNQEELEKMNRPDAKLYRVRVSYEDPVSGTRHGLGEENIWAENEDEASVEALDKLWNHQLSLEGCKAITEITVEE